MSCQAHRAVCAWPWVLTPFTAPPRTWHGHGPLQRGNQQRSWGEQLGRDRELSGIVRDSAVSPRLLV